MGNFMTSANKWKDFSSRKDYKGDGFEWQYIGKGALGQWEAFEGSQMEVWQADDEQFIELDASKGNHGIKLQVAADGLDKKDGIITFVLTWQELGRSNANADNTYTAMAYTEEAGNKLSRKKIKDKDFPEKDNMVGTSNWVPQILVFTVKYENLHPKNKPERQLWIGFDSKNNTTYGALIKDVRLVPVELEVQRADRDGNGLNPTDWESQESGTVDDLLSIWEKGTQNGRDWINVRLKEFKNQTNLDITWNVDGMVRDAADDKSETGKLRWNSAGNDPYKQSTNVRKIDAMIGSTLLATVSVDVPIFPRLTIDDLKKLGRKNLANYKYIIRAKLSATVAENESKKQQQLNISEKNAFKHAFWHLLCAQPGETSARIGLIAGFIHEEDGRSKANSRSCGSTMDLHNNVEGSKKGLGLKNQHNYAVLGAKVTEMIKGGQLWIWEHPELEEHSAAAFYATMKGSNEHIPSK